MTSTQDEWGWATNGDIRLRWTRRLANTADARQLLLVNGLSSPLVSYEDGFVDALNARGFDVVRYDNRDAGQSSGTEGGYTLADMANDGIAVMDAVGWDNAHIFGMSMGGMIVQQLGIDHGSRINSICSVMSTTGNPKFGTPSKEAMEALLTPSPDEREAWLEQRVRTEKIWASPAEYTVESSRAKGELLYDYGVQPRNVINQYNAVRKSGSREDALASVTIPTLVLHGDKDTLLHMNGGQRTAEIMPNARLVILEGMGHDLPPSYWPRIADEVSAFAN